MMVYMVYRLTSSSTHFSRDFGQICPGKFFFEISLRNGNIFATSPTPPSLHGSYTIYIYIYMHWYFHGWVNECVFGCLY